MQMQILSSTEKLVLTAAAKSSKGSLLSLRKDTYLGVDAFVAAVQTLEQKKLLTRDGVRFKVLASAFKWLATSQAPSSMRSKEEYLASISAPRLSVEDFFIPDREAFLKDLQQSR